MFPIATIAAGQIADTYLFQYRRGGQVPGQAVGQTATVADTNMPGVGQLPMGHQMLVYSLQVIPDEFADADNRTQITPEPFVASAVWKWRKIMHQTWLELVVEQTKSFVEGRLDHFPQGGGLLFDSFNYTDGAEVYTLNNGMKGWHATRRLAMPIHLGSLENFYVVLKWPRGALDNDQADYAFFDGFGLTVRLTGPRQRPTA